MIHGFEEETGPLTEKEKRLIPGLVKGFSGRIGADNAITSKDVIKAVEVWQVGRNINVKMNGARVRKLVNHIRLHGLVKNLVASSKGYYVETDMRKIDEYIESLRSRAGAINAIADSYLKVRQTELEL